MSDVSLYHYDLPLTPALELASTKLTRRQGWLLRIRHSTSDGEFEGWGEASPLPGFSQESIHRAGDDIQGYFAAWQAGENPDLARLSASAGFAISCAQSIPLTALHSVNTDSKPYPMLSGYIANKQAAANRLDAGLAKLKIKVAMDDVEDEVAFIQRLCQEFPDTKFILDANQGWSTQQAGYAFSRLDVDRIAYIEEPCASLTQSLRLAEAYQMPLALDESLLSRHSAIADSSLIKAWILKPTLLGGLSHLKHLFDLGRQRKVSLVVSSCFESSLGLRILQYLAQTHTPGTIPGLDTFSRFDANLILPWDPALPTLAPSQLTLVNQWRR